MKVHVINLDRSTERLRQFQAVNAHLQSVERFAAVDGARQSLADLKQKGMVADGLRYSEGAIGAALSHLGLWEIAVERNAVVTVCEDDTVFHKTFDATAQRLLAAAPAGWDIVLWGWNFDSAVHFDLLHAGVSCVALCDQSESRRSLARFQEVEQAHDLYRLRRAFGALCYTVSPNGARKLREAALPLRPSTVWVPLRDAPVTNYGIDVVMCAQFEKLNSFVCVPPLVLARNEGHASTIQGTRPAT